MSMLVLHPRIVTVIDTKGVGTVLIAVTVSVAIAVKLGIIDILVSVGSSEEMKVDVGPGRVGVMVDVIVKGVGGNVTVLGGARVAGVGKMMLGMVVGNCVAAFCGETTITKPPHPVSDNDSNVQMRKPRSMFAPFLYCIPSRR